MTSNVGEDTELRIRSLRPEEHPDDVRDETPVEAGNEENTCSEKMRRTRFENVSI